MKTNTQPALRLMPRLLAMTAALVVILGLASPSAAAPGVFMKVDGVETWSTLTGASSDMQGPTTAQPVVTPGMQFSKRPDKSSPLLLQACGAGTPIKRVTFAWRDHDGTSYRVTLEDVLVSSFTMATDSSTPPQPLETCDLHFTKIEWSWFGAEGAENYLGGIGTRFEIPAQQATERNYEPFQARVDRLPNQARPTLLLTCAVQKGRTYRISASSALTGEWNKLEDFTALEDGKVERAIAQDTTRLFLRVEALD